MTSVNEPVRPSINATEANQADGGEGETGDGEDGDEHGWLDDCTDQMPGCTEEPERGRVPSSSSRGRAAGSARAERSKSADANPSEMEPMICQPCGNERVPNKLTSPIKPSAEDVERHNATHLPYRDWCPICVKARGREDAHRRKQKNKEDESGLPTLSLDYQTLNEVEVNDVKVIVGKNEVTGEVLAHNVLEKGPGDAWVTRRIVRDMQEMGLGHAVIKTDGEPSMIALQERLQSMRAGRTVLRNPPAHNPQSNGPCEKAVQDVSAQLRTIILALQARFGVAVDSRLPIVQWAVEHAAFLLNHFNVGKDGMTPHERSTGKKWKRPLVEFGEVVLAKLALRQQQQGAKKKQKRKLAARSIDGVWVGQVARTGEHIVIKPSGDAVRCRTIKRVPEEHRWVAEKVLLVEATPRIPSPSSKKNSEDLGARVAGEEEEEEARAHGSHEFSQTIVENAAKRKVSTKAEPDSKDPNDDEMKVDEEPTSEKPRPEQPQSPNPRQIIVTKSFAEQGTSEGGAAGSSNQQRPQNEDHMKKEEEEELRELVCSDGEDDNEDEEAEAESSDPLRELKRKFDEEDPGSEERPDEPARQPQEKRQRLMQLLTAQWQQASQAVNVREMIMTLERDPNLEKRLSRRQRRTIQRANKGNNDESELHPSPGISEWAKRLGLREGWALDLTGVDPEDGQAWDLSKRDKQEKVRAMLRRDKPFILVASPMCGPSIIAQGPSCAEMSDEEVKAKIRDGLLHLQLAMEMCEEQRREGRFFLFEHPNGASSRQAQAARRIIETEGVHRVSFDFCTLGMNKNRTAVITNSSAVAELLRGAQCNGSCEDWQLKTGHRTRGAQLYPDEFCKIICEGVKREMDTVEWRNRMYEKQDVTQTIEKLMNIQAKMEEMNPPEEDPMAHLYTDMDFVDDVSGQMLDKSMATKARRLEIEYFKQMGVYTKVKREKWMKVISTRWLDINKGDLEHPDYRARLVGREIKRDKRDDLFAATPPLESLRMVMSICASHQHGLARADRYRIMAHDVKRAYFYAPVTRPIFITIPDEDREDGDEEYVGQLNLSLYGTRDAAMNWSRTYTEFLESCGFIKGRASPCNFFHPVKRISTTVHGDDFTSTGTEAALKWLDAQLKSRFEVKSSMLGPDSHQQQQIRVLNRVLSWESKGLTYEADQRHAEIIIREMGVVKPISTPGCREDLKDASQPRQVPVIQEHIVNSEVVKEEVVMDELGHDEGEESDCAMSAADATRFRGLVARANYLAQDRPDLQFPVKELSRRMATPRHADWQLLKRIARYLIGAPRAVVQYCWQSTPSVLDAYVDSDWAGCKATSRSTSGGAAMMGWHMIKTWCSTQAVTALSSGEAELYSLAKGGSQVLGLMSLAADLGMQVEGKLHTDANAALGIVQREGLGKLRHVRVQYLWLQGRIRGGELLVGKVPGKDNPADMMTKNLAISDIVRHCEALGVTMQNNRADSAPQLATFAAEECRADYWEEFGAEWHRLHIKPRETLFTPLRVNGAPPAKALTACRVTEGRFLDDGTAFRIVDHWTARATAHRSLGRQWIGKTTFMKVYCSPEAEGRSPGTRVQGALQATQATAKLLGQCGCGGV